MPLALNDYGNTVCSTLPILMHDLRADGRLRPGVQTLLIGFGVGLSWAACTWTETWQSKKAAGTATAQQSVLHARPGANGDALPESILKSV